MNRGAWWPLLRWPQDGRQALELARLEHPHAGMSRKTTALERLARDMGFVRVRIDGTRRWVSETRYLAMAERGEVQTYRFGSSGHADARQKVAPERRREIAAMGAAARYRRRRK